MALARVSVTPSFAGLVNITPSAVPAYNTSVETFTVKGMNADSSVVVNGPSVPTGLMLDGYWVAAQDVLTLVFTNLTNATITPVAQNFVVVQL
jgi:hypothetical protein